MFKRTTLHAVLLVIALHIVVPSQAVNAKQTVVKRDLAAVVAGTYEGSVVSDVRGPSGARVTIVVKRVGKNMVEISGDHDRIPLTRIGLIRTSGAIMFARGYSGFLIEDKDRGRLDLTIDEVTMILRKV